MRSRFIRLAFCFIVLATFLLYNLDARRTVAQAQAGPESLPQPAAVAAGVRHLSIPAAAFVPGAEYYSYWTLANSGRTLWRTQISTDEHRFLPSPGWMIYENL